MVAPIRKPCSAVFVLTLTFLWGCGSGDPLGRSGSSGSPPPPGGEASHAALSPTRAAIEVTNDDVVARYYLLFEAELAAVVDPNLDPAGLEQWIRLQPGESIAVPLEAVPGWTESAEAVVIYSWTDSVAHAVDGGTQWGAEGWYTMRVDLSS